MHRGKSYTTVNAQPCRSHERPWAEAIGTGPATAVTFALIVCADVLSLCKGRTVYVSPVLLLETCSADPKDWNPLVAC